MPSYLLNHCFLHFLSTTIYILNMEFKTWLQEKERPPRVLWFTGMNSSGSKPKKLATLGYDVKSIGTTNHYFAAYLGRIKRYQPFFMIRKKVDTWGSQHMQDNVKKHDEEIKNFVPDVVVGTSQGGAVAMKLGYRYPNAKFVLGCPAWKIFNSKPDKLPSDTIVIHGKKDITVPVEDSIELAYNYGFRLTTYSNIGHGIPLPIVKLAIDKHLISLGITIPKNIPTTS